MVSLPGPPSRPPGAATCVQPLGPGGRIVLTTLEGSGSGVEPFAIDSLNIAGQSVVSSAVEDPTPEADETEVAGIASTTASTVRARERMGLWQAMTYGCPRGGAR